ncbi:Zn-dependent protease with chaperone function [Actinokineospora baliensis]|uniref:M48 family metalloprotease n=1 Tax=Actinokineospora baliensis TaxID=547056 RepID=UPI00195B3DF4|nr:M48 family metalloprotease [Actinokineospora baliensis]MBM7774382.1 Zn-dependent protease with chaperone function [Actinokineospora baliensis]
MFDHFAWSVLATPVLVLVVSWLLVDRLRPDLAARVFAGSAVVAAAASTVNLAAFALKALAELPVVASWGGWSHQRVVDDTAHVPWVSWVSLGWLIAVVILGTRAWLVRRRQFRAVSGDWTDSDDVVVIDDPRVDAFAVPGRPGRIVVTAGLSELLDDRQFRAVVAHERAHLDGGHHRLVWWARIAAVAHPLLRPVARQVEYLVERAADEAAAEVIGDREQVGRAIGHAALAASGSRAERPGGALMALGASPGIVPRRVAALFAPGRGGRWSGVLLPLLAVGTVVWTGECVYDLFELLSLAGWDGP